MPERAWLVLVSLLTLRCAAADDDADSPREPTWRGLAIGAACDGDGECGAGVVEATSAGGAVCSTQPGGSAAGDTAELCDDLDNDCSGEVDDLPGTPLADLQSGVCAGVQKDCRAAGGFAEPDYTAIAGYEVDETQCDTRDNDCDGDIDEGCPDCSAMDSDGTFPNCDSCPDPSDCDYINSPNVNGYVCGCSAGCPCGLACGSIMIASNVAVTACTQ
jgi:hypothetical protein